MKITLKRSLAFFLALIMCLSFLPVSAFSFADGEGGALGATPQNVMNVAYSVNGAAEQQNDGTPLNVPCGQEVVIEITGSFINELGDKSVTVDVPTGWIIVGVTAPEGHAAIPGIEFIPDSGYNEFMQDGVKVDAVSKDGDFATPFGTVTGATYTDQHLKEYEDYGKGIASTHGGKIVFTFNDKAQAFYVRVKLMPDQFLYSHTVSSEKAPDVTITLQNSTNMIAISIS